MEMSKNFRTGINDQKNISDEIFIVWKATLNIPKSVNWFPSHTRMQDSLKLWDGNFWND